MPDCAAGAAEIGFLAGGGEMGALMRAHDWTATPLGPPEIWSQPLRTAVRLLLNTGHPMYIWWGPELLCFYNDAYRASIGPERHPSSLGRPGREVWDEIWPIIGPQIEQVMSGRGATWHENQLVPITRNGQREDVYWTYSYGPIDDEAAPNGVGGVLVVCAETTEQVLAAQRVRAEHEHLERMFEQAPGFMAMLQGPEHRFTLANAAYRRLIGGRDVVGQTVREALPELEDQGFFELLDQVYSSGEPFRGSATPVRLVRGVDQLPQERVVNFLYQPVMDAQGCVTSIFVEGSDITRAHRAQEALRASERHKSLLVELLQGQRETSDPKTMMAAAAKALGQTLEANRVGFFEMANETTLNFDLGVSWTDGVLEPLSGTFSATSIGSRYLNEVRAGRTIGISDTASDPLSADSQFGTIGARSIIGAPIILNGCWHAGLYVNHAEVRTWTEDEIALVTAVADQTWNAVERARAQAAGHESEARYRQIVEGAEEFAILTLDEQGIITSWNSGAERITGFGDDEAIGQPGTILFTPEDRAAGAPDREMSRAQDEGRASDERWHLRKDGSRFWGSGLMMRLDEPGGGFLKIFRNRTTEHEAEARYRTLFETIDAGFCVVEVLFEGERAVDNRFLEVNPAFERQTGLVGAVGRTIREMIPDIETRWFEIYGRVARTGVAERFEFGSDELGQWFDVHALRVGAPEERRLGVFFNDITERRRTEERLRDLNASLGARVAEAIAERRVLADIVDSSNAAIMACDLDYRILAINKANVAELERVYGKRPKIGDHLLDLLADMPEHQAQVARNWGRALGGEEFMTVEEFGDAAHERVSFEVRFGVLRDRAGHRVGAFQTAYDVTDRIRAQAQLEAAQEALRQAQKMEAVGQLTGGVAHDFNNLLTIIRSSTGLLRRPDLSDERRRTYMDAISDTVDRAAKLTGQLLAFARRQALKPEVFDACARVEALSDMLGTILGGRIHIVTELHHEPCFVKADVGQFETALVNMAVNARDAMDGEGRLTVRVNCTIGHPKSNERKAAGPVVAVSLTDTGAGIPPGVVERIFEPFFTTKEVGKGTGLGLSQVYGFAKQSGGDVSVTSQIGRGTTFTLYLPQAIPESVINPGAEREPAPPEQGHGRRVLVVEDNIDVGTFSTQLLRDLGYETTWAVNAKEALARLGEAGGTFDVVFSDVVMPGMNGVELGEEIRRRFPKLPVILTSGYSDVLAQEGRHGFELLQKPYAVEDLSRVLRRVSPGRDSP